MPIRILFVDDEPYVLDGLRRMLHPLRKQWEMSFARSGPEAISILETLPHDVVVSDMRMPDMDGSQLLGEVCRRWPETVRIVLSGHADQEMILRSIGTTHQFLTKPCEPDLLRSTVERSISLNAFLGNERMKPIIAKMDVLPSAPLLLRDLNQEISSPNASLRRIGEIISQDVGMTAKILRLVNSAYFGLRREISDPGTAVTYLGMDTVTALVMVCQVFQQAEGSLSSWFDLEALWNHSFRTAQTAKLIAQSIFDDRKLVDDALAAGMLHDAGRLVLAVNFPDAYKHALAGEGNGLIEERKAFGVGHCEVGGYLMGLWGLRHAVVEAIAYHHTPSECAHRSPSPLTAVHVACSIDRSAPDEEPDRAVDREYLATAGVASRLGAWIDLARSLTSDREDAA